MAWIKNQESAIQWADGSGDIGGFTRNPEGTDVDETGVGPVSTPNGTKRFIIVDDTGVVKSALPP